MMQPHGGGRMEEKHNMCDAHVCGSIAMHSTGMCYDSPFPLLFTLAFVLHFLLMPFLHMTIIISFHFSHDGHPDYKPLSFIPLPSNGQPRFLCSDNPRYLLHTIYHIELPLTFHYYIAWSVHSPFRYKPCRRYLVFSKLDLPGIASFVLSFVNRSLSRLSHF